MRLKSSSNFALRNVCGSAWSRPWHNKDLACSEISAGHPRIRQIGQRSRSQLIQRQRRHQVVQPNAQLEAREYDPEEGDRVEGEHRGDLISSTLDVAFRYRRWNNRRQQEDFKAYEDEESDK